MKRPAPDTSTTFYTERKDTPTSEFNGLLDTLAHPPRPRQMPFFQEHTSFPALLANVHPGLVVR